MWQSESGKRGSVPLNPDVKAYFKGRRRGEAPCSVFRRHPQCVLGVPHLICWISEGTRRVLGGYQQRILGVPTECVWVKTEVRKVAVTRQVRQTTLKVFGEYATDMARNCISHIPSG